MITAQLDDPAFVDAGMLDVRYRVAAGSASRRRFRCRRRSRRRRRHRLRRTPHSKLPIPFLLLFA